MKSIADLLNSSIAKTGAVVAVTVAEDAHVLGAVQKAYQRKIADFILIGNREKIVQLASELRINLAPFDIIDEQDSSAAAKRAVALIRQGKANILMKGLIDTAILMKAVLDRDQGIRTGKRLSHVAVFDVPSYHKLLFITDSAVNVAPNVETKKDILQNAIDAVRTLGIDQPKIALVCAKEKVDVNMPVTAEYAELVRMHHAEEIIGGTIEGPYSLDIAVSKEAAVTKGVKSTISGDVDILMCPDIEAGNILYKSLAFLACAENGGIVLGAKAPMIVTSRADSSNSKLISIALAVCFTKTQSLSSTTS